MDTARFLDVFEEETNKMKENIIALIITLAIILKLVIRDSQVLAKLGVVTIYFFFKMAALSG